MSRSCVLLERMWIAVSPEGDERPVSIQVWAPVEQPDGAWISAVSLGGIRSRPDDIHGMDSWQAVSLAMHHAAVRVEHLQTLGWTFLWDADGREVATGADLFPLAGR